MVQAPVPGAAELAAKVKVLRLHWEISDPAFAVAGGGKLVRFP